MGGWVGLLELSLLGQHAEEGHDKGDVVVLAPDVFLLLNRWVGGWVSGWVG